MNRVGLQSPSSPLASVLAGVSSSVLTGWLPLLDPALAPVCIGAFPKDHPFPSTAGGTASFSVRKQCLLHSRSTNVKRFSRLICPALSGHTILLASRFPREAKRMELPKTYVNQGILGASDSRSPGDEQIKYGPPPAPLTATLNSHVCTCVGAQAHQKANTFVLSGKC